MLSIAGLVLLLACTPTALLDFAIPKWKADKAARMEDTYKWLYQATRGGEHAVPDRAGAKEWLDGEWSSLGPADKHESLIDPLCPGGEIVRINLRKFKASGGTEDDILDAFLTSAAEYRATVNEFTAAWFQFGKRLKKKGFGQVTRAAWEKLDTEMKAKNYPAIHHSEDYNKLRKPAYRIVTKSEADKLLAKLKRAN
jgi:hypothetical protein